MFLSEPCRVFNEIPHISAVKDIHNALQGISPHRGMFDQLWNVYINKIMLCISKKKHAYLG